MSVAAVEEEDGCVPGSAVVGREVGSSRVRWHSNGLVWRSGGIAVICFCMPDQTEGTAYYVVGGGLLCQWRRTLLVAEA